MPKQHNLGVQTYYKVMYNPHMSGDAAFSIRKVVYPNDPDERTRVGQDEERWRQAMTGQGILFTSWWSEDWHRQYHRPDVHRAYLLQEHARNCREQSQVKADARCCKECGIPEEHLAPDKCCGECTEYTPEVIWRTLDEDRK